MGYAVDYAALVEEPERHDAGKTVPAHAAQTQGDAGFAKKCIHLLSRPDAVESTHFAASQTG